MPSPPCGNRIKHACFRVKDGDADGYSIPHTHTHTYTQAHPTHRCWFDASIVCSVALAAWLPSRPIGTVTLVNDPHFWILGLVLFASLVVWFIISPWPSIATPTNNFVSLLENANSLS